MTVIEDEVIRVLHRTINRLSVTLNVVGKVAGDIGVTWELTAADGVQVDWLSD